MSWEQSLEKKEKKCRFVQDNIRTAIRFPFDVELNQAEPVSRGIEAIGTVPPLERTEQNRFSC